MTKDNLETRLAVLEREVAELKAVLANGTQQKDWRRTIGMFTDDPGMQEIFNEAMKIRDEDRKRAYQRHAKRGRKKA